MRTILILLVLMLMTHGIYADDLRFETTEKGIVDALTVTQPDEKIKTRALNKSSFPKMRSIRVVCTEDGETIKKTIEVPANSSGNGINLRIEFDSDSSIIRPGSFHLLNELGRALQRDVFKGKAIIIRGHTDSDGDLAYNLQLSLQRAEAVKAYLTSNFFISPSIIQEFGYGEAMPLVPNTSAENKQINRRVEIAMK